MWFLNVTYANDMRAAAGLFARRGYDNVQAAELARAMRVSVGTLYRRYRSKQGIALAVRDFAEKQLSERADEAFFWKHERPGLDFARAFHAFWRELVACALEQPGLFGFTFLHWHAQVYGPHSPPAPRPVTAGAPLPRSHGGATRALVRQVLEKGEKEGVLAPGCTRVGEGLVWGALVDLVRAATQEGARVGESEVLASAEALWRALARADDPGPRGNGTPLPGSEEPSPGTPGSFAAALLPTLAKESSPAAHPSSRQSASASVSRRRARRCPRPGVPVLAGYTRPVPQGDAVDPASDIGPARRVTPGRGAGVQASAAHTHGMGLGGHGRLTPRLPLLPSGQPWASAT